MPQGRPNSYAGGGFIRSMREKYEPHMKLEAKVDFNHNLIHGIEGKLRDLPKIHKTLSKSFGMQRKTLLRVINLEKQVVGIKIIIEKIEEGLEDAASDTVKKPPRKKKPRKKKPPKKSAKKPSKGKGKGTGTPGDWDEKVPGDWDRTTGGTPDGTIGEPDGAIKDPDGTIGDPEGEIGEPDEAILDGDPMGDPDGTIGDPEGDKEPAIFGEPDPLIDPDTDLRPVEDLPEDRDDTTGGDVPEDKDDVDGGGHQPGLSEDQEVINKFIFKDLKSIHSTISTLTGHTKSTLERVIGIDKRVSSNEKKITLLKNILKSQKSDIGDNLADLEPDEDKVKSPLSESIKSIADSTTSIQETLIRQQDLDKGKEDDDDIDDEQDQRDDKENKGEGIGAGIKKVGAKMLAPVQSAFEKIKEWLIKLFAAKAVMMFMNWFSDPANAKKVASLFRFVKDWWPAIVTGLLLFAGSMLGPTGIIIGITALVVGFVPKIINAVKSIFGFGKDASKEAEKGEKLANKSEKLADKQDKGSDGDDIKPDDVSEAPEPGSTPLQPPAKEFNKGGSVPGQGDKDTVPAMLTPGEFVLTKDAVEKYGTDTLEGMNAAAGGTNEPKEIRPGFKGASLSGYGGGGSIQPNRLFGYSGGGEVKEQVEEKKDSGPKLNRETGSLARRIEPLITGQEAKSPLMSLVDKHPMVMMFKGIMRNPIIQNIISNVGSSLGGGDKEDPELDLKKAIEDLQNRFNYSIYDGNYKSGSAGAIGADGADGAAGAAGEGGSSPLDGFISAVSTLPIVGKPLAKITGLLVDGVENIIQEKLQLSGNQSGTATPDAPVKPSTTVAYKNAQQSQSGGGGGKSGSPGGGEVPDFNAGAKVDSRKIKVLGISR